MSGCISRPVQYSRPYASIRRIPSNGLDPPLSPEGRALLLCSRAMELYLLVFALRRVTTPARGHKSFRLRFEGRLRQLGYGRVSTTRAHSFGTGCLVVPLPPSNLSVVVLSRTALARFAALRVV